MTSEKIFARIAATLLCLAATACLAATHPLNQPMGMAVDGKGNLYVANHGGNQILVYNSSAQQMTAKTITKDINAPMTLAWDALGNLWVSNVQPNLPSFEYFSEYLPTGKEINPGFAGSAFVVPAFAIDGVGDLWVAAVDGGGQTFVAATNGPCVYGTGGAGFAQTAGSYTAIAARGPWIAFGTTTTATWEQVGPLLGGSTEISQLGRTVSANEGVLAMTFDNNTNFYYATNDGVGSSGVWFVNLATGAAPVLPINVTYLLSGLAVDSIHGRLYISNASTNTIAVYSTSTWLQIGTIQ
jgi:DNA-binding beta-propeller fold protein YncE